MNQATLTGRPILYILWIGRKLNILIPNSRGYSWIVWRHQNNHLELTPAIGVSPNFSIAQKKFSGQ